MRSDNSNITNYDSFPGLSLVNWFASKKKPTIGNRIDGDYILGTLASPFDRDLTKGLVGGNHEIRSFERQLFCGGRRRVQEPLITEFSYQKFRTDVVMIIDEFFAPELPG